MDHSKEEYFVNTFIKKDRRERLLYELTDPKKRYQGISRFCHQAKELIMPSRIVMEGTDIDKNPQFEQFVKNHQMDCYVLSPDPAMNDMSLSLQDATEQANMCMDAVIIIGSGFALIYGEPEKGGRDKFVLFEQR